MKYLERKIVENERISEDIFVLSVTWNRTKVKAGQFFMLKCWGTELTLMRPISVFSADDKLVTFMYRIVGKGTQKLSKMKPGDKLWLLGPCGNGYPCESLSGKVAVVGGGVGIPPLYYTAKTLTCSGVDVEAYLGFRDELFAVDDFSTYCENLFVSSENGPEGYHGYITDLLKPGQYDAVLTCGPEVMMRKVAKMCAETGTDCYCSLEHRMACGLGACLGCSIRTKQGMKRVCKDGPVFKSTDLLW